MKIYISHKYHINTDNSTVIARGMEDEGRWRWRWAKGDKWRWKEALLWAVGAQCSVQMMFHWTAHLKPVWFCEPMSLQ